MSGEEDYTIRGKIIQDIAVDARILLYGQDYSQLQTDEGTEGNAAQYVIKNFAVVADEAVIKTVGANSLKYSITSTALSSGAVRLLGASFVWNNFVEIQVYTRRPSGKFTTGSGFIYVLFLKSSNAWSAGKQVRIYIKNDPADTWVKHTIGKAAFANWYGGIAGTDTITHHGWANSAMDSAAGDIVYLDGLDIYAGANPVIPLKVSTLRRLQCEPQ